MKVQVKIAFKSYFFVTKKVIKKQTGSEWNFLQPLIPVCRGAYIPYFKMNPPISCCPLFSENYLNTQVRINKMINKHTVNYHPSPSQWISRIHPLIFLWTPKGFISPESFLNFFLNLYIPPWLRKSFKFIVLRLLANTFVSQKIESAHFYSCFQAKFSPGFYHYHPGRRNFSFLLNSVFWRSFFPQQNRGRELWRLKNYQN